MRFFPQAFGFLNWVGISHFINLLFISLLIRSGLEILSASRDDDIRREARRAGCALRWRAARVGCDASQPPRLALILRMMRTRRYRDRRSRVHLTSYR